MIAGCYHFDTIDRSCLRELIKQRVNDRGIMRLIGKRLGAGVGLARGAKQGKPESHRERREIAGHKLERW